MGSPESVAGAVAFVAMGAPMVLFPERCAKLRHRHASDSGPMPRGVRNARLTGGALVATGILVLLLG